MAVIVSDSFNRADNPTSLGTTDTGQVWNQLSGDWGIASNEGVRFNVTASSGKAIVETGFTEAITSVDLMNPEDLSIGAGNCGIIFRYFDSTHYFGLTYERFPGGATRLRLKRTYGSTATVGDFTVTLVAGDNIACAYCGSIFEVFVNGVSQGTYNDQFQPQLYGTQSGLQGFGGTLLSGGTNDFENFLVETNGTCTPTYNCVGGACVDPGDGTGTYATQAACLDGCSVAISYDCVTGECADPGDGSGTYPTLAACVDSGCGAQTVTVETVRFDAGTGSGYYVVAPIVDSGDELRSKVVKSFRATGKFTNAAGEIYGYDVSDVINTSDLEDGLNSATGQINIIDTSGVAQTPREPVNVPNAVLHTVRILGDDTGETVRDRIDEIVIEVGSQGVRR